MNDVDKTQEQLINELVEARERIVELNALETERKLTLSKARRRAAQLALIYDVGQRVSGELELEALFSEIVAAVRDAFDYYGVMLLLLDEDARHLDLQSVVGDLADVYPEGLEIAAGEGMIGYAAETGQVQISADVSQDSHYVSVADEKTRSELVVPIKSGQKVIGVLDLQSNEFNAFDGDVVMVMETLADQIAVAIENARLFEEARIRAEELAVLNELGQALTTRLSVEEVLDEVYRQVTRLVDTTNLYIAFYNPKDEEIAFLVEIEEGIRQPCRTRPAGQGLTEYIIHNRTPVLIPENVPEWIEKEMGVKFIGRFAFSWLGVPLIIDDQVLGVMAVQSFTTPGAYDEHDRDLLTAVASQVTIALQNAQLYETVEQELAERKRAEEALQHAYAEVEKQVEERTAELQQEIAERERLQQQVIKAQKQALEELSTPIIPVMERIIVMPLVGNIDSMRARDITRSLLAGIRQQRARVVILDITGVSVVDSGVAEHLNKTIRAARLKGARTIVTGISDGVAETIVDLGIDWGDIETVADLQTGLRVALAKMGRRIVG